MAEEDEKQADAPKAPEVASPGRNPIVTLMLLVNAILITIVAFFQYQQHQAEANRPSIRDVVRAQMKKISEEGLAEEGEKKDQKDKEGQMFPLESFTANLAQGDGPRRYLRLNTVLRFSNDSRPEEFKARAPQIRDTIISIINTKRPEDLLKVEGKAYLKEEIRAAINAFLIDGHVVDVFYVDFQIH